MASAKATTAAADPFCKPLEELAASGLPPVFTSCVAFLKRNCLNTEGLFRKKGDGRMILHAKRAYEQGKDPVLAGEITCPHTVAGILRLWLSCIPRQVVPTHLVKLACNTQMAPCHVSRLELLRLVLSKAEPCVLDLLYSLAEFLHHYRLNQRRAKLPPPDLAQVFAPLLLRLPATASDAAAANAVRATEMLIADYRPIFTRPRVSYDLAPPQSPTAGTRGKHAAEHQDHHHLSEAKQQHDCCISGGPPLPNSPLGAGERDHPSSPPAGRRGALMVRCSPQRHRPVDTPSPTTEGLVTPGRISVDAASAGCKWWLLHPADLPDSADASEASSDAFSDDASGGGINGGSWTAGSEASSGLGGEDEDEYDSRDGELTRLVDELLDGATTEFVAGDGICVGATSPAPAAIVAADS